MKFSLFLATGFEESEAIITIDILRRGEIKLEIISIIKKLEVNSLHNVIIKADKLIENVNYEDYNGFILPGGRIGVDNLSKNNILKDWLLKANNDKKIIGAICAAPQILGNLGILDNKKATSYPGCFEGMEKSLYYNKKSTVIDENIITSKSIGTTFDFALKIINKVFGIKKEIKIKNELLIFN